MDIIVYNHYFYSVLRYNNPMNIIEPHMSKINAFLDTQRAAKKVIFPEPENIFRALRLTPLSNVKVVILGQDPYHGPGQANGLCFSVNRGIKLPPSLKNIYKELETDCGIPPAKHGCLSAWAKQGVLLLNSILTVEMGQPASHRGKGWEQLTDDIIQYLSNQERPIVFVLWGDYAQKKGQMIDESKHYVIRNVHPSPLSVHRGFFGSKPFSKINDFLIKTGQQPIDWHVD